MSDRLKLEHETTGGHSVIVNDFITGAESWKIRQIYMRSMNNGADVGAISFEAEAMGFELVIVSLDGILDDVATRVMALPLADYQEIVAIVTPIIEGKKKSETPSPAI
ncbi:MAG: hypothetical protein AAB403_03690 [Planctomycetota bacterium]